MIENMITKRSKKITIQKPLSNCEGAEQLCEREKDMREVFAEAPRKKKRRWKMAMVITLLLVCLLVGVIYACGIFYFKDKFLQAPRSILLKPLMTPWRKWKRS